MKLEEQGDESNSELEVRAEGAAQPVGKSRKRGVMAYRENPFLTSSTVTTRRKRVTVKGGKAVVDRETGEIEDIAEVVAVREVDDEQFVKIFTQNLKVFFGLSPTAMKVLQVILHQVQQRVGSDQVMLNLAVAEHYFTDAGLEPMGKTSFYRAVHEMIEKQFIAESVVPGLYFINPNLFFNGDRVRFVQEFKRKRSDADNVTRKERISGAGGSLSPGGQLPTPPIRPRPHVEDEVG